MQEGIQGREGSSNPVRTAHASVPIGLAVGSFIGSYPEPAWFGSLFREAEEAGFECCLIADRPTHHEPFPGAITLMALAAATTSRMRIVGLMVMPYRQPVGLAREIGTLAYLSSNRVVLVPGLGGDFPQEMAACGVRESRELRPRLEESLALCRELWSGEEVNYQGAFYKAMGIRQLPGVARTIPIWLAHRARSDASLRRTAELADGWLASWVSPQRLAKAKAKIASLAETVGRKSEAIAVVSLLRMYVAPSVKEGCERMATFRSRFYGHPYEPALIEHLQIAGPPEYCVTRINEFIAAGAEEVIIQVECPFEEREAQIGKVLASVLQPGSVERPITLRQ